MDLPNQTTTRDVVDKINQEMKKAFENHRRVLSFDEYLALFCENPQHQSRSSAMLMLDMLDHYGKTPVDPLGRPLKEKDSTSIHDHATYRFHVFDRPIDGVTPKLVGHESVQTNLYQSLKGFSRQKVNNRLLLLHGPNGSAKSTLAHGLMAGLEDYSKTDEGALYTFSWVFPLERYTRGGIGLHTETDRKASPERGASYAKLTDDEVAARIPSELKDHPLLLIPKEYRQSVLVELLGQERAKSIWSALPNYLKEGGLSHRCQLIFESLLSSYNGDYTQVLNHVRVERFFFSRRYRKGLVTVEPQMHVDAKYNQLTLDKNISALPPSLQGLNFFSLSGDLIDGNRGIIEYSDLLKRPIDTFKYLLVACESGSVNVGASIAFVDSVMIGSTNELQLDAFKEFPDFGSFKGRIKLIRVPYLTRVSQEKEIYSLLLEQLANEKHITPHVDWTLAMWAVLTRLKKPNSIHYPPNLSSVISNLSPLEKLKLYDTGEMPANISPEDRKLLRSHLVKLFSEYDNLPYYEGRIGASVREIKSIIFEAAQGHSADYLSPLMILKELREFVKRVTEYDFLKQDIKDGYHDAKEFIAVVESEYLKLIDREVRESMGLYEVNQWEDFIRSYVQHVSLVLKKEKYQNPVTGKMEDPNASLISEFEKIVEAPNKSDELNTFRKNIISQVGAWSLDHQDEPVIYAKVFPDYWGKIERHYYDQQKSLLTKMHNALEIAEESPSSSSSEGSRLARQTLDNMVKKLGYCEASAKEVVTFLLRKKYN